MGRRVKKVIHFLDTGIFHAAILFSCGYSHQELLYTLNRKKLSNWAEPIIGNTAPPKGSKYCALKRELENTRTGEVKTFFYIILTEQFTFTDWDYVMLAHEVLHICQFMLKDILDRDREFECEAYLHSHIMQQCLKQLRS